MLVEEELDYSDLSLLENDIYNVPCLDPKTIYVRGKPMQVPCQKCYICEKKRKSAWVLRLQEEIKVSKCSFWLTLTYDESCLKMFTDVTEDFEGNVTTDTFAVLNKRDCQLFFKSLRQSLGDIKLRYFLVGEYGPTSYRPHYHMLLFLDNYCDYWKFDEYVKLAWKKGYYKLRTPTQNQLNYCAKYTISIPDLPDKYKIAPQYMVCSKGIGKGFLTPEMISYYKNLLRNEKTSTSVNQFVCNGYKYALPRYYKDRIFNSFERNQISHKTQDVRNRTSEIKRTFFENAIKSDNDERANEDYRKRYMAYSEKVTSVRRHLREEGENWRRKQMKKKKL